MAKPLSKTVVVAYGRSAVAKSGKKGALRNLHPIDMGGLVLKGVMEKIPKLDPSFFRSFKKSTGVTPNEYIRSIGGTAKEE